VPAYGGAVLLRDVMAPTLGLVREVDVTVGLKKRRRGLSLSEGHFVAAVAESVALGPRCVDNLAMARGEAAQEPLRGFAVPVPQKAGSWLAHPPGRHYERQDRQSARYRREKATAPDGRSQLAPFIMKSPGLTQVEKS